MMMTSYDIFARTETTAFKSTIKSMSLSEISSSNKLIVMIDYYLHSCLLPIIIIFGVIGNLSNIYIFTRPALFRSCSIYFLTGAINGLVLLLFGTTTRWLGHTYPQLDATSYSLFYCRFRNYLMNVIYDLAPYFTACVTIDRFCSSSVNANIRRFSSRPKLAYIVIIFIIITTFIAYFHNLIYYTIINDFCQTEPGFYTRFFSFFTTIYYCVAFFSILIFGLWTVHNVKQQRRRIEPMRHRITHADRKHLRNDGQILMMLFIHVACYTLLAVPFHITLIVAAVDPFIITDSTFLFIQRITIIALNFNQAVRLIILFTNIKNKICLNYFVLDRLLCVHLNH